MSLLAEQLVDEWLNLNRFFTRRGIRHGVHEIDLLGVRPTPSGSANPLEAWHVEVQVSFRPIGYLGRLTDKDVRAGAGKSKTSAKARGPEILRAGITEWVNKKFDAPGKIAARERCWPGLQWSRKFVHGRVKDKRELKLIAQAGVELIPFSDVLRELSEAPTGQAGAAGGDLVEIVRFQMKEMERLAARGEE